MTNTKQDKVLIPVRDGVHHIFNTGSTVAELVEMYGEEAVFFNAVRNMTNTQTSMVTRRIQKKVPTEDILVELNEWQPGTRTRYSGKSKLRTLIQQAQKDKDKMTEAERQELMSLVYPSSK